MSKQIAFATFAAAALLVVQSPANAGGTGWSCRTCGFSNGTQLSGATIEDLGVSVSSVVLPSGDSVEAHRVIVASAKKRQRKFDDLVGDNTVTAEEYQTIHSMGR